MSKHKDLIEMMSQLESAEVPYALASVYSVHGSSSGKVGDKALFNEKGIRLIGYIGGGCIENRVAAAARESILDGNPLTIDIDLDSDQMNMGIPCGGYMSVIVEPQLVNPIILIRGMGRVVEVLCQMASLLKFKVIIQAPKDEANRYPDANEVITDPLEFEDIDFSVDYFILATHHRNDDQIACEALKKGIPYVGVVASAKKTGIIVDYLKKNGISDEDMSRFHSPTGLDLKAKTAEEIALSILSEIVMLRNDGSGRPMRQVKKSAEPENQS
ncbi:MAG: XdhC family protein [Candidatus Marinimicrobia bacterium]|jgi:xanthine dehydrogenase accessory factor|nr:XdhC family protein [Candidatus Neomarinimicrobiota bacterium]MDP6612094.1 XdhC family protein [Candidatus Neomarinimicrobiota bacterium]|tara:strand:- start:12217 stop:13032 length:816 start_codon:yes stop_codon:yes gene_type:complete